MLMDAWIWRQCGRPTTKMRSGPFREWLSCRYCKIC
ncbi:hypothetical protein ACNKHK_10635 [Shigella flexneri]